VTASPLARAARRFAANRAALVCAALVAAIAVVVALGPPIAGAFGLDATTQDALLGPTPPSLAHPLGTDLLGRDLLVRTLEGGRVALRVGLLAALVAVALGVAWGGTAGLAGGRTDEAMMRVVDILYSLPQLVFVIVVMAVVSSRSELLLCLLVGSVSWLTLARVVRAQVLALRSSDLVVAARALGAGGARVLLRHILPNAAGTIVVYASLLVPSAMLQEAFLSFLGLGVPAPRASWGTLVQEGVAELLVHPWLLAGPGVVMATTILALNFVGDGLRDAVDPV
jgi:oligopeptide transport system permease protein